MIGIRVGRLTILSEANRRGRYRYWKVKCDCGNIKEIQHSSLRRKLTKSCGCIVIENTSKLNRLPGIKSSQNRLYENYSRRKKIFKLTKKQFFLMVKKRCHYCKTKPMSTTKTINQHGHNKGHFLYNGIDRVDNKLGYILGNCVPCCKQCNYAKYTQTYEVFIDYIKRLVKANSN